jgi:hypothetical protein
LRPAPRTRPQGGRPVRALSNTRFSFVLEHPRLPLQRLGRGAGVTPISSIRCCAVRLALLASSSAGEELGAPSIWAMCPFRAGLLRSTNLWLFVGDRCQARPRPGDSFRARSALARIGLPRASRNEVWPCSHGTESGRSAASPARLSTLRRRAAAPRRLLSKRHAGRPRPPLVPAKELPRAPRAFARVRLTPSQSSILRGRFVGAGGVHGRRVLLRHDPVIRFLEDNPWGAMVFLFIVGAGALGALVGADISLSEYLAAVATAGGLLGVGHSIHRGARHLRRTDLHDVPDAGSHIRQPD